MSKEPAIKREELMLLSVLVKDGHAGIHICACRRPHPKVLLVGNVKIVRILWQSVVSVS